jgi:hypothetical protein
MSDDRLIKSNAGRETRVKEDTERKADGLVSTSAEAMRSMMEKFIQEALPEAPNVPGFHTCWLSTTSQYDPIHKRLRLGYTPVSADEITGFDHLKVKSGENIGHISVNEMVLYKIPEDMYQAIMTHFHHNAPREEAEKLTIQQDQLVGGLRDSKGRPLVHREGDGEIDRPAPIPTF